MLVITHYQRLLDYIVPDFVHVLLGGRIVALRRQGAGARARGEGLRLGAPTVPARDATRRRRSPPDAPRSTAARPRPSRAGLGAARAGRAPGCAELGLPTARHEELALHQPGADRRRVDWADPPRPRPASQRRRARRCAAAVRRGPRSSSSTAARARLVDVAGAGEPGLDASPRCRAGDGAALPERAGRRSPRPTRRAHAFVALNAALLDGGVQCAWRAAPRSRSRRTSSTSAPRGRTPRRRWSRPRVLIVVGPGAAVTVVENYRGLGRGRRLHQRGHRDRARPRAPRATTSRLVGRARTGLPRRPGRGATRARQRGFTARTLRARRRRSCATTPTRRSPARAPSATLDGLFTVARHAARRPPHR